MRIVLWTAVAAGCMTIAAAAMGMGAQVPNRGDTGARHAQARPAPARKALRTNQRGSALPGKGLTRTLLFTPEDAARLRFFHPLLTPERRRSAKMVPLAPRAEWREPANILRGPGNVAAPRGVR